MASKRENMDDGLDSAISERERETSSQIDACVFSSSSSTATPLRTHVHLPHSQHISPLLIENGKNSEVHLYSSEANEDLLPFLPESVDVNTNAGKEPSLNITKSITPDTAVIQPLKRAPPTKKLTRGIHAPPKHLSHREIDELSSKYLWESDDVGCGNGLKDQQAPLSPPESVNRSINFDQLWKTPPPESSSCWPFEFMNNEEGLFFNNHQGKSENSKEGSSCFFARSASPNVCDYSSGREISGSTKVDVNRNIAPAGLGEFDYNLGLTGTTTRSHFCSTNKVNKWFSKDHPFLQCFTNLSHVFLSVFERFSTSAHLLFNQSGTISTSSNYRNTRARSIAIAGLLLLVTTVSIFGSMFNVSSKTAPHSDIPPSTVNSIPIDESVNRTGSVIAVRRDHIIDFISRANITNRDFLLAGGNGTNFNDSPQSAALDWIMKKDGLRLDPLKYSDRKDLIGRYVCAVFYFSVREWGITESSGTDGNASDNGVRNEISAGGVATFVDFHDTWLSDKHICEWSGIRCEESHRAIGDFGMPLEVTEFHFINGRIGGQLEREIIVAFQNLRVLHLSADLKGPFPEDVTSLKKLRVLSLGNNNLTGTLPSQLELMTSLQLLGLHDNQFESSIPHELWTLSQLSVLYLNGNYLTGSIPAEMCEMQNIIDLRLSNNEMSGTLPNTLGNLVKLRVLYLDENHFRGSLPTEIGEIKQLQSVFLHNNDFNSQLPSELEAHGSLVHFIADDNGFSGEIPQQLLQASNLEKLWLTGNNLNGTVDGEVCQKKDSSLELQVDCNVLCSCCKNCYEQEILM